MTVDASKLTNEFIFENDRSPRTSEIGGVKFVSLAPKIFQNLRSLHSVDENEIITLFSVGNLAQKMLNVKLQSGKGGAFFVLPKDGKYLIKSINEEEYEVMKTISADLYMHYLQYPSSFINPIYGCYALYLSESNEIEPQYFVLMKNVLDIHRAQLPDKTEILCFDMKGSSAGRSALDDPKKILAAEIPESVQKETLKDEDFFLSFKRLEVMPVQGQSILNQLEKDAAFFSRFMLIDYSLLLFVMNIPYRSYVSTRRGISHKAEHEKGPHAHELILAEKTTSTGKNAIIIEERDKATDTVFRITNEKDIELVKGLDDEMADSQSPKDHPSAANKPMKDELGFDINPNKVLTNNNSLKRISKDSKHTVSKLGPTRISVINFPKVTVTEDIAKYSVTVNNQFQNNLADPFASDVPFGSREELKVSSHADKVNEEKKEIPEIDSAQNEMLKKKMKEISNKAPRADEEIGITKEKNIEYAGEDNSDDLFVRASNCEKVSFLLVIKK